MIPRLGAIAWRVKGLALSVHSGGVGQENQFTRLLLPMVKMLDRCVEALKAQDVYERRGGVDHFHGDRILGRVAVTVAVRRDSGVSAKHVSRVRLLSRNRLLLNVFIVNS